jgi:hypothetical protein
VTSSITVPFGMLFGGANIVTFQAILAVLMAAAKLALAIFLVHQIGIAGAVFSTVVTQIIIIIIPYTVYVRYLIRSWEKTATDGEIAAC